MISIERIPVSCCEAPSTLLEPSSEREAAMAGDAAFDRGRGMGVVVMGSPVFDWVMTIDLLLCGVE